MWEKGGGLYRDERGRLSDDPSQMLGDLVQVTPSALEGSSILVSWLNTEVRSQSTGLHRPIFVASTAIVCLR